MATRRERVVMDLEDNFTGPAARIAAATKLIEKSLNDLNGTAVRSGRSSAVADIGKDAEATGRKSEVAGRQIDRFSGRLALLAKTAAVLGPALVPIGASAIPAVMALTAQLGAAAGAAGVAALAFTGLGDGLTAINDYQLEPTAENLQAMRIEMEKLGPAGAEFARFLDSLGPELQSLQFAAREGLFPGVEEGITNLLDLMPQVQTIISEIAEGMGTLAADAGADLAGPQWRDFFNYLESDARPILDDLGRTVGNFAQGFAEMIVAFGPLSRSFSGGLEDMSERFAEWAASLSGSDGFQGFVQYVREAGPQVLDLLGSMADLFVGIVTAAAPVGDAVLPALTGLVKIVTALVDSPLGPVFFTAAAALSVYSTAATVAEAATARLAKAQKGMALLGGAKGGVAALGVAALALAAYDLVGAGEEAAASMERLQDAVRSMDESQIRKLRDETQALIDAQNPAEGTLSNYWDAVKGSFNDLTGKTAQMEQAVAEANDALRMGGGLADLFAQGIGGSAEQMEAAATAAQDFSGALAELNGWLDKRQALRDYRASLADLGKGLKEPFSPETAQQIDTVARNLSKVASQIKDKGLRADFLAGARQSLLDLANNAGPKGQKAVQRVIDKLDEFGLTKPPAPKLDADDKPARDKIRGVVRDLNEVDGKRPNPTIDANPKPAQGKAGEVMTLLGLIAKQRPNPTLDSNPTPALAGINTVRQMLAALDGDSATVTTYMRTVRSVSDFVYGSASPRGSADGGTVPRTGLPYADRHPYLLADGEEVVSNRYGQADRWRPFLKAINAGRLAEGGTAGRTGGRSLDDLLAIAQAVQEVRQLRRDLNRDGKDRLDGLNRRIARLQLQVAERELRMQRNREEREARQAAREEAKARAGTLADIAGGLSFAGIAPGPELSLVEQARADIDDFKAQVLEAGGVWDGSMREWAKSTMSTVREYQSLQGALERETAKRDELAASLDAQRGRLDELVRTMESYSAQVAGNFLSNPFGQSRTETIAGAPGAASAALTSAQTQLAAIRSSATGDSVGAAAEASRLIAQIAQLQTAADAETAPVERTVTGLEAFRETLDRDIEQARRMTEALNTLTAKGLDTSGALGLLYQQLAASGDVVTAEDLARLSAAQIDEYERLFAAREDAAATVGALATQEVYGQQQAALREVIAASTAAVMAQDATLAVLNAEIAVMGERVRLGAASGVEAAMRPQMAAIDRRLGSLEGAVKAQARQAAEQRKKAKA